MLKIKKMQQEQNYCCSLTLSPSFILPTRWPRKCENALVLQIIENVTLADQF